MPSRSEHLQAAHNNRILAEQLLLSPDGLPWAPVLGFYSALHMLDAYLAILDMHPTSHVSRRTMVQRNPMLQLILVDYRELEKLSREARYDLRPFTPEEARSLLDGELRRVTAAITALLQPANP